MRFGIITNGELEYQSAKVARLAPGRPRERAGTHPHAPGPSFRRGTRLRDEIVIHRVGAGR
ncbi:hypothetical protein [Agromyces bauzanensis]|uniref:Uncharacterized protein n=1 Tax=Agromyces bauzanensis TaxID=1308924 RepID=A0A917UNW6_9MICO|nr:hypothetical protein [Agromyces bauzanensis]GGJ71725.1 hypothetical protein GCM10011372_07070 [Agromyces bauzanensis]